jgi:hypothetical protein
MTVVAFPKQPVQERPLTYRQLSLELGVSDRFLRERLKEGMPSCGFDYAGRRLFLLSDASAWLDARNRKMGRSA